jgi:hypothetical protein
VRGDRPAEGALHSRHATPRGRRRRAGGPAPRTARSMQRTPRNTARAANVPESEFWYPVNRP